MYRNGNFSFVIDSHFQPFSMQEMLIPFTAYKDAFEKTEAAYDDLVQKADTFKYLAKVAEDNPDSKAAQIYKGYADELDKQAKDLAQNGLSMGNRQGLMGLKKRFQGEIGRLMQADAAMKQEQQLRRQMNAKDSSMLYANDNLSIDSFLDGETPNLYGISGDELRKEGAQYAQAASSRIYGNTQISDVNKYFQEIAQTQGYSPELLSAWKKNLESIPEFSQAVEDIMQARGVSSNLSGINYERARQSIINGIMEGSVYQEKRSVQQNPGVLTAAQAASNALGWANHNLNVAAHGMIKDKSGKYVSQDEWMYSHDENGRRNGFSKEYQEAVKNNLIPGKNISTKGSSSSKSSSGTKASTRKLKEARQYDGKGSVSPISKDKNTKYGKKISFAEAISIDPSVAQHDPGYEDYYEYFQNGNNVSVVPIASSVSEQNNATSAQENDNSDNQL